MRGVTTNWPLRHTTSSSTGPIASAPSTASATVSTVPGTSGTPAAHEAGELLHDVGARAHAGLDAGQRQQVAAQGDLQVQPVLQRAQHAVLLARELHRDPVVELDDLDDALSDAGGAHMLSDSRPPPMTCQWRWKTLWRASAP